MSTNFSRRNLLLGAGGLFLTSSVYAASSEFLRRDESSDNSLDGSGDSSSNSSDGSSNGSSGSKQSYNKSRNSSRRSINDSLISNAAYPFRVNYGAHPSQFGNLYVPLGSNKVPLVVLIHGGGWEDQSSVVFSEPMALDMVSKGVAVWNVEYRRSYAGGGWPMTFEDMDAIIRSIPRTVQDVAKGRIDLYNVNVAGHSAGGQLAAWMISRRNIKSDILGPAPELRFKSALLMSAVFDTRYAVNYDNDRFLPNLLGGYPDEIPKIYYETSAINYVPTGVSTVCIHGTKDTIVSYKQSVRYVKKAVAHSDRSQLVLIPGVGHGEFGNVLHPAWWQARDLLFDNIRRPVIKNWR